MKPLFSLSISLTIHFFDISWLINFIGLQNCNSSVSKAEILAGPTVSEVAVQFVSMLEKSMNVQEHWHSLHLKLESSATRARRHLGVKTWRIMSEI